MSGYVVFVRRNAESEWEMRASRAEWAEVTELRETNRQLGWQKYRWLEA